MRRAMVITGIAIVVGVASTSAVVLESRSPLRSVHANQHAKSSARQVQYRNPLGHLKHSISVSAYSTGVGATVPGTERLTSPYTMSNGNVSLNPASASTEPSVSQRAAVQAWAATGLAPPTAAGSLAPTQPTSVLFGLVTDSAMATIGTNGSTEPQYVNSPVWIIEYHHAVVPLTGPDIPGTNNLPQVSVGTFFAFVSATTGKYEFASATTLPTSTPSVGFAS